MSLPKVDTLIFFSKSDNALVKAIFGRLIPGSPEDPGAVEAGAHVYIDHALAGYYRSQGTTYRRGLTAVNSYSRSKYQKDFVELKSSEQDSVLTDMQKGAATGFDSPGAAEFFNTLFLHVREGTFCDPAYHGNQNLVGWKMIGFDGAQVAHFDSHMEVGADQSKRTPILTLAEMEEFNFPAPENGY